jgi:hypothetical protein
MIYLAIYLTKDVQKLYSENDILIVREMEEDISKLKDIVFMSWKIQY